MGICRPRLNRGGKSIAFMGGSNGQQIHRTGHGSMNINSYERELAQRTGRGNEMYQAGTRSWGSLEPTPKRQFLARNHFQTHGHLVPPPPPPPPPPTQRHSWQQQQPRQVYQQKQHQQQMQQYLHQPAYNTNFHLNQQPNQRYRQQQQRSMSHNGMQQGYQIPPNGFNRVNGVDGYSYPHYRQQQRGNNFPARNRHYQHNSHQGSSSQRAGFNFRSYNQVPGLNQSRPVQQTSSTVNNTVLSSLKAQLKNTLKQNRRSNDRR